MSDHASKLKGLAWLVAACIIGAVFACGLSPIAHAIPWSIERKIAFALAPDSPAQCNSSMEAKALLQKIVTRIYPVYPDDNNFSIDVRVVKNPAINAYATLGGNIFVNTGLLKQAESPEELAGVLAHEIEHVHHRHIMEGAITRLFTAQGIAIIFSGSPSTLAGWANYFFTMSFTRTQESQADEGGLQRLQTAHVDNQGFRHFFERMETSGGATAFLSDHPSNAQRIEMVGRFSNQNITPVMTQGEWKLVKHYCDAE